MAEKVKGLNYYFIMNHGDAPNTLYEWAGVSSVVDAQYRSAPGSWTNCAVIILNGHNHDGFPQNQFSIYKMNVTKQGPVDCGTLTLTNSRGTHDQVPFYSIDIHSNGLKGKHDQIVEILMG